MELDEQCARAMGWTVVDEPINFRGVQVGVAGYLGRDLPYFASDHNSARLLEDEIERRGLQSTYIEALFTVLGCPGLGWEDDTAFLWSLIRATPEQKARAFLNTVSTPTSDEVQG